MPPSPREAPYPLLRTSFYVPTPAHYEWVHAVLKAVYHKTSVPSAPDCLEWTPSAVRHLIHYVHRTALQSLHPAYARKNILTAPPTPQDWSKLWEAFTPALPLLAQSASFWLPEWLRHDNAPWSTQALTALLPRLLEQNPGLLQDTTPSFLGKTSHPPHDAYPSQLSWCYTLLDEVEATLPLDTELRALTLLPREYGPIPLSRDRRATQALRCEALWTLITQVMEGLKNHAGESASQNPFFVSVFHALAGWRCLTSLTPSITVLFERIEKTSARPFVDQMLTPCHAPRPYHTWQNVQENPLCQCVATGWHHAEKVLREGCLLLDRWHMNRRPRPAYAPGACAVMRPALLAWIDAWSTRVAHWPEPPPLQQESLPAGEDFLTEEDFPALAETLKIDAGLLERHRLARALHPAPAVPASTRRRV